MEKSSPSEADSRIVIGKIGAPHGVKGEMKIIPMTDFPKRFDGMKQCYIDDRLAKIKSVRYQKKHVLMVFDSIATREDAAALTGAFVSVDRSEAMPLKDGEYYISDIIGLSVEETDGTVYVVSLPGRAEDVLVPALKKVVKEISIEDGRMVVLMPEVTE